MEAALQTLMAFLRKTHGSSVRWHGSSDLNTRLLALSQGWGVKELVGLIKGRPYPCRDRVSSE